MSFLKRGKKEKSTGDNADTSFPSPVKGSSVVLEVAQEQQPLLTVSSLLTTDSNTATTAGNDDDTVIQSGNAHKVATLTSMTHAAAGSVTQEQVDPPIATTPKTTKTPSTPGSSFVVSLAEELRLAQEQINIEKAGKRKLFHSLVKVANELRKAKNEQAAMAKSQAMNSGDKQWYDGGLWRAPQILSSIQEQAQQQQQETKQQQQYISVREAISLSDLFFHLVIVMAFTRVGVTISNLGYIDQKSFYYFAILWNIWNKESNYTSRFDTTDLSAQVENLITCFAVLFGSLSVHADINTDDATHIMMMASSVAILHCALHIRVAISNYNGQTIPATVAPTIENESERMHPSSSAATTNLLLSKHVFNYAIFNIIITALESITWIVGIFVYPVDYPYRWCLFVIGIVLGLRIPRAFLANDFHAASSQRGVLFILLLGFLLQSIVVVASEFLEYQTPTIMHYAFIGAACLLLFCIKLLYVTDGDDTVMEDHAVLVNRFAGFFFNVGQFSLLLSTTIMGSGLNLLTHDYLSASAALPGPAKTLVTGGFAAVLLSTFFIKSLHLKRVPTDARDRALFIGAYVIQSVVLFVVVGIATAMSFGVSLGLLEYLMQTDIQLLFSLSGAALCVVIMSWLDEGVELMLYHSAADSREFRVHPFGLWWFLKPDVTINRVDEFVAQQRRQSGDLSSSTRLSVLSPLLGSSLADLKLYNSISSGDLDIA